MTRRLPAVDPGATRPDVRSILEDGEARVGLSADVIRFIANSPAALTGYLALDRALREGSLDPGLRQQISLAVGELNACRECVQEHVAAARALGLDEATIRAARRGSSPDPTVEAALQFAQKIAEYRGDLTDDEFDRMRRAEFSDEEIAEIIANVVLVLFTNFFDLASSSAEWGERGGY